MPGSRRPDAPPRNAWRGRVLALALGLARSILLWVPFALDAAWPLAFLAPLPLILFAASTKAPARLGAWFGVGTSLFWAGAHSWVAGISVAGFPIMAVHLAAFDWLTVVVISRLVRRFPGLPTSLTSPVGFVAVEVFRGELAWSGYPWFLAGHGLVEWPVLAAPAGWIGAYGVSFMVVAVAGALADARFGRRIRAAVSMGSLAAAWAGFGLSGAELAGGRSIRVGVVQTNVPQDNKLAWTFDERLIDWRRFEHLTISARTHDPDVIVWPETMFPGAFLEPVRRLDSEGRPTLEPASVFVGFLGELSARVDRPMIVGAVGTEGLRTRETIENGQVVERFEWDREFNSAYLIDPARRASGETGGPPGLGVVARYDKVHLTPFGEVMPLISRWPWLESRLLAIGASGMRFGLSPGAAGGAAVRLAIPTAKGDVRAATPICFESGDSGLCRSLVFDASGERRADLLVNLTNDGWFGRSDAMRRQAVRTSRWRCVELGTPMIRSANTGNSCAIDAHGRLEVQGNGPPTRGDGVLVASVELGSGRTVFARVGNAFAWSVFALALAGLGSSMFRRAHAGSNADGGTNPRVPAA